MSTSNIATKKSESLTAFANRVKIELDGKQITIPDGFPKETPIIIRPNGQVGALFGSGIFANPKQQSFEIIVPLFKSRKEVVTPEKEGVAPMITVPGYRKLNQAAGLNLIRPEFVIVNGQKKSNPYTEVDSKTGTVNSIHVRTIAVGYSPIGQLVMVENYHVINTAVMLGIDLLAKLDKDPTAGTVGIEGSKPEKWDGEKVEWVKKQKTNGQGTYNSKETVPVKDIKAPSVMLFFPLGNMGDKSYGIWIDPAKSVIKEALSEQLNRQQHLVTKAINISERNALKAHPAIAITNPEVDENGNAYVTVYASKSLVEKTAIDKISAEINKGIEIADAQVVKTETVHDQESHIVMKSDVSEDEMGSTNSEATESISASIEDQYSAGSLSTVTEIDRKDVENKIIKLLEKNEVSFVKKFGQPMGEYSTIELVELLEGLITEFSGKE